MICPDDEEGEGEGNKVDNGSGRGSGSRSAERNYSSEECRRAHAWGECVDRGKGLGFDLLEKECCVECRHAILLGVARD